MKKQLLIAAILALPQLAAAHGAHVHGVAEMDVAIEGNKLVVTLESPADNLLGFEHAPKNAAEKAKLQKVTEQLNNAAVLFTPDAAAQCKAAKPEVKMPDFAKGSHSDIEVEYHFDCASLPASVALPLWKSFPGFKKITVNLATAAGQKQITLKTGQTLNLK